MLVEIDRRGRHQRIGEIDQKILLGEEIPGRADQQRSEQAAAQNESYRSEHRRENHHQQTQHQRRGGFESGTPDRLGQQRLFEIGLDHLGMDFDARHLTPLRRRRLVVVQSNGRGADQHDLAVDLLRRSMALDHVGCGDVDRGIVPRGNAPRAGHCSVGGDLQTVEPDTVDRSGRFGLDHDRRRARQYAQYLEAQGRHHHALGPHHRRHAPHDSVSLGVDREQAATGRRCLKHAHIAQKPVEIEEVVFRIPTARRDSGLRKAFCPDLG